MHGQRSASCVECGDAAPCQHSWFSGSTMSMNVYRSVSAPSCLIYYMIECNLLKRIAIFTPSRRVVNGDIVCKFCLSLKKTFAVCMFAKVSRVLNLCLTIIQGTSLRPSNRRLLFPLIYRNSVKIKSKVSFLWTNFSLSKTHGSDSEKFSIWNFSIQIIILRSRAQFTAEVRRLTALLFFRIST